MKSSACKRIFYAFLSVWAEMSNCRVSGISRLNDGRLKLDVRVFCGLEIMPFSACFYTLFIVKILKYRRITKFLSF